MVPADPLLAGAVDLDVGGVQVDRRPDADKAAPLPGSQQPKRPGDQAGHGPLDPGDLRLAEAARQRGGGSRRRRWQAAQQPPYPVGALVVQVGQEVPAGQQRLGQPHQQLAGAKAAAAALDRPDLAVDRADHAEGMHRLGDHHQPRRRGQAWIIGAQLQAPAALSYRVHPTGAFRSGLRLVLATPILFERKAPVPTRRDGRPTYLRIPVRADTTESQQVQQAAFQHS
jgi:hypothetical protein